MVEEIRTTQTTEIPSWLRAYQEDILARGQALSRETLPLPGYQVAGRTPMQERSVDLALQGVGAYQPMLQAGASTVGAGVGALQQGADLVQQGMPMLQTSARQADRAVSGAQRSLGQASSQALSAARRGEAGAAAGVRMVPGQASAFQPSGIAAFMSPYEDMAVQQALSDIGRQGQIAQQGVRAGAVGAGAFGGSRQAVAEQELQRNIMEQQARTAAQMRAAGFESAAGRAQSSFESAQARQLQGAGLVGQLGVSGAQLGLAGAQAAGQMGAQAGQLGLAGAQQTGQMGLAYGQMGQGLGALGQSLTAAGLRQAQLGEAYQGLNMNDINLLNQLGVQEQAQRQSELDAQRQTEMQNIMQPYQQLGFYSDIFQGMPSQQTSLTSQQSPSPSLATQLGGLGLGMYSLSKYQQ